MAHHNENEVGMIARMLKTSLVEPGSAALGKALGKIFLSNPSIVKALDGLDPEWRKKLPIAVRAGAGALEFGGKGSVAYIFNEGVDAFGGGIAHAIAHLEGKTEDQIANDLFVISALDQAAERIKALGEKTVIVDLQRGVYDFDGCARGKGKKMTLSEATRQGFVPSNCLCTGRVVDEIRESLEKEAAAPKPAGPVNLILIVRDLEKEAAETGDDALARRVAHFRAVMNGFPKPFRAEIEQLVSEPGAKENIRALLAYDEDQWPVVVDWMLKDPVQAKARGAIRSTVEGIGKLGSRAIGYVGAKGTEVRQSMADAERAIREDTAAVRRRGEERRQARKFKKKFRAWKGGSYGKVVGIDLSDSERPKALVMSKSKPKRGWFAYLAYGMFFFTVTFITYYVVTH